MTGGQLFLNWCTSWIVVATSNAINIKLDWNVVIMIASSVGVQCLVFCGALFNFTILEYFWVLLFSLSSFLWLFSSSRWFDSTTRSSMNELAKSRKERSEKKREKYKTTSRLPLELVSLRLVFGVLCSSFLGEIFDEYAPHLPHLWIIHAVNMKYGKLIMWK